MADALAHWCQEPKSPGVPQVLGYAICGGGEAAGGRTGVRNRFSVVLWERVPTLPVAYRLFTPKKLDATVTGTTFASGWSRTGGRNPNHVVYLSLGVRYMCLT